MDSPFLQLLSDLSNPILVLVTLVYVILTGSMVREMRRAREEEVSPNLVATLFPITPQHVVLHIHNAGRGPALDVTASIQFSPLMDTQIQQWRHPVILPGSTEKFRLPGGVMEIEELIKKHQKLIVELSWRNAFNNTQRNNFEFNLLDVKEGWFGAKWLMHPDDLGTHLGRIKDELAKITSSVQRIELEQIAKTSQKEKQDNNQ